MKVQLITAKHTEAGRTTNLPRPPIGLEILAACLEQRCAREGRKVDIVIYDGEITDFDSLSKMIGADWVGFSDLFSNHCESLLLAEIAKQRGSKVVFGGPNATHLADRILNNHTFVDFVVTGDGERAFCDLLLGVDPGSIPNLCFRCGDSVLQNRIESIEVNTVPLFSFDHIHGRDAYFTGSEPVPFCSIRGCAKAVREGRCTYCSIPNQGLRLMNPDRVWQQVSSLKTKYGVSSFFEAGDSFLIEESVGSASRFYPQRLLEQKPSDVEVSFRIYERPDMITEESALLLKKIGVNEIFLGFEHVDGTVRGMAGKTSLKNSIWNTLDILSRFDMNIIVAVMFGLPGETQESALRNRDFVLQAAARYPAIRSFFISGAMPIYGSRLFKTLISDAVVRAEYDRLGHALEHDDSFEYHQLMNIMLRRQTAVSPDWLHGLCNDLVRVLGDSCVSGFGAGC